MHALHRTKSFHIPQINSPTECPQEYPLFATVKSLDHKKLKLLLLPPLPPLKIIARPQKCSVRGRYENGPVGRTSEFTVRVQQLCLKNSLSNMFTYN